MSFFHWILHDIGVLSLLQTAPIGHIFPLLLKSLKWGMIAATIRASQGWIWVAFRNCVSLWLEFSASSTWGLSVSPDWENWKRWQLVMTAFLRRKAIGLIIHPIIRSIWETAHFWRSCQSETARLLSIPPASLRTFLQFAALRLVGCVMQGAGMGASCGHALNWKVGSHLSLWNRHAKLEKLVLRKKGLLHNTSDYYWEYDSHCVYY